MEGLHGCVVGVRHACWQTMDVGVPLVLHVFVGGCCDCEPLCLKETGGHVGRVGMPRKRENGRPQRG